MVSTIGAVRFRSPSGLSVIDGVRSCRHAGSAKCGDRKVLASTAHSSSASQRRSNSSSMDSSGWVETRTCPEGSRISIAELSAVALICERMTHQDWTRMKDVGVRCCTPTRQLSRCPWRGTEDPRRTAGNISLQSLRLAERSEPASHDTLECQSDLGWLSCGQESPPATLLRQRDVRRPSLVMPGQINSTSGRPFSRTMFLGRPRSSRYWPSSGTPMWW